MKFNDILLCAFTLENTFLNKNVKLDCFLDFNVNLLDDYAKKLEETNIEKAKEFYNFLCDNDSQKDFIDYSYSLGEKMSFANYWDTYLKDTHWNILLQSNSTDIDSLNKLIKSLCA